jgi:hypothetical protein
MFFHNVTHPYQVFCHLADEFLSHQTLRMLYSLPRLQDILLLLEDTEPSCIELAPKSYPIAVESNFVYSKALIRKISRPDQTEEKRTYRDLQRVLVATQTPLTEIDSPRPDGNL